jgi:hypothetical protein
VYLMDVTLGVRWCPAPGTIKRNMGSSASTFIDQV